MRPLIGMEVTFRAKALSKRKPVPPPNTSLRSGYLPKTIEGYAWNSCMK
jgi:hypothetical protein